MPIVTILATRTIRPGEEKRLLDLRARYVADTAPGARMFALRHAPRCRPAEPVRIYEQFADEAALHAHRQAPHALAWRKQDRHFETNPMAETRKVIITCAVTGAIHTPSMSPHLPVTAEAIADAAVAASEAEPPSFISMPATRATAPSGRRLKRPA